jgi:nucleoid DNA-binding protein
VALTQTQLASAVADRAEISRAEAKRVLDVLEQVVLEELGNAESADRRLGAVDRPRQAAKPASVDVRARPLAKAKAALPSVQKARRRLAPLKA